MRKRKHGKKCPIYYKHISPITLQRKVNVEKDVFSSCHERGIEKNSESPRGIELQTFGFARNKLNLAISLKVIPQYCTGHPVLRIKIT